MLLRAHVWSGMISRRNYIVHDSPFVEAKHGSPERGALPITRLFDDSRVEIGFLTRMGQQIPWPISESAAKLDTKALRCAPPGDDPTNPLTFLESGITCPAAQVLEGGGA